MGPFNQYSPQGTFGCVWAQFWCHNLVRVSAIGIQWTSAQHPAVQSHTHSKNDCPPPPPPPMSTVPRLRHLPQGGEYCWPNSWSVCHCWLSTSFSSILGLLVGWGSLLAWWGRSPSSTECDKEDTFCEKRRENVYPDLFVHAFYNTRRVYKDWKITL